MKAGKKPARSQVERRLSPAADVSNEIDLRRALAGARSVRRIHGIIHAAGSQRPESILDKDMDA
jgi:hypothetical protein